MSQPLSDYIYCYKGTEVLINNFGLEDPEKLKKVERTITAARLIELLKKPIHGKFDTAHLKKIHQYIFQDIYPFAGEFRRVDIAKGLMFCHCEYIERELDKLFLKLKEEKYLKNTSLDDIPARAAFYMGEINAIHPFRDGNGRAQREFIRELLLPLNLQTDYSRCPKDMMLKASIASFNGDDSILTELYKMCIYPKN